MKLATLIGTHLFLAVVLAGCGARTGFLDPPDAADVTVEHDADVPDLPVEPDVAEDLDVPEEPDVPDLMDVPDVDEEPPECLRDVDCDDGLVCTGAERCVAGMCAPGTPPNCTSPDPCFSGACLEPVGCVFTPVDRDGDGHLAIACGGDDCDDTDRTVFGGAPELCDFKDNDCDGEIDEGLTYVAAGPGELNISPGITSAQRPQMRFDGTDFDAVYDTWPSNPAQIFYVAVRADGVSASAPAQRTFSRVLSTSPDLVWTGSEYGLFSHFHLLDVGSAGAISITRLDPSGAILAGARNVTSDMPDSDDPAAAWDGTAYGVAFLTPGGFRTPVRFTRVSPGAAVLTPDWELSPGDANVRRPATVWTGTEYAVAFVESGALVIARIDSTGSTAIARTTVATLGGGPPAMVWTGSEIGLAWSERGAGIVRFARLDVLGTLLAPIVDLTVAPSTAVGVAITWTGAEYGISFQENSSVPRGTHFVRIGGGGAWFSLPGQVSTARASDGTTAVAPGMRGYGVAFTSGSPMRESVLFRLVSCP